MELEPTLTDFPFLEHYRKYGRLPLETQSLYQDAYSTILKNKLEEKFKGKQNLDAVTQKIRNKRFEIKFLSDSLSELRSALIIESEEHPESTSLLEKIYLEVEHVLENKIEAAQSILNKKYLTFTPKDQSQINYLYMEMKDSFIVASLEDFIGIFGIGEFTKPVIWIRTEVLLVYFVNLLEKFDIIVESDLDKIHLITSNCFVKEDGRHFKPSQLANTRYNTFGSGKKPRQFSLIDQVFKKILIKN